MQYKHLIIFNIFLLSSIFAQSIFDNYEIPEYQYQSFQLNGSDLFNSISSGDNSMTTMNMGADYISKYQSPGYNYSYGLNFVRNSMSMSEEGSDDIDNSDWSMNVPFTVDKYFNDTKGMFGFADGEYMSWGGDQYDGVDDTSDLPLTFGAGYGRIISAKPVAQAYAIADALGIDADDDTIAAIASVIGSESSYESTYKDDATQQYYNDLAEASGVDGSAMQIQKVLTSPAYNIADRFTGWDIRAGITNNYMQDTPDGVDEDAGYMTIEGNYAMPIEMDSQVLVGFVYTSDSNDSDQGSTMLNTVEGLLYGSFPDIGGGYDYYYDYDYDYDYGRSGRVVAGGWSTMNLNASYTKDHSYSWSSSATLNYLSESFETSNNSPTYENSGMIITLSTTYAILNQLAVTGSYTYGSVDGDSYDNVDPITQISTNVTYWVY